jgi:gamma-glutamyl hercynylcysteine S-oxide hydrolase
MCRMLAYVGPRVTASTLVFDPPWSLLRQCTEAREQTSGCENPDGWGIAWYPAPAAPERYRTTTAMPADEAGRSRLGELVSGHFVVHVRHKSPGSPTEVAGNAPFVHGPWTFAHNGFVEGFRDGERERLRAELSPARREALAGDADSEVLFGLVLDRLDQGGDVTDALPQVISGLGPGKYNFFLTDGTRLVASRWGNSLHLRRDHPTTGAVIVASEPYDDEADWQAVPDRSLVVVDGTGATVIPIGTPLEPNPMEVLP